LSDTAASKPRVLCILPSVPLPADTGGNLRTLSLARALDDAFETTTLTWARDGQETERFRARMRGEVYVIERPHKLDALIAMGLSALTGRPLGYSRYGLFPKRVLKLLSTRQFDVIHFDHPHTALALPLLRRLQPHAKFVLDAHNVEAEILERMVPLKPLWKRPLFSFQARRIRALERSLAREVDLVLTCSDRDAAAFRALGAKRVRVVPNGVPPMAPMAGAERKDVLFVGSMDWQPNTDAAIALARDIWPLVRGRLPGARLVLVGRNPPEAVRALAADDIIVAGGVPSVQPYLESARVTAIPLRAGSGTRIKILEAWAAGVPVVASRIAAEGLPYGEGRDLLLAESPAEFAQKLERVFAEPRLARRLAESGRKSAEPFGQSKIAEKTAAAYRDELGIEPTEPIDSARRYKTAYDAAVASTA
jgi:glycosyltransferase involved in cell wall biosynthesis